MRMRRDPEAIAAYREMLRERGVAVDAMSDELVVETMERAVDGILRVGRAMAEAIKKIAPAAARAARAITDVYVVAGGAQLAEETAMDLHLRDEVAIDVRLLELFDDTATS